MGVKSISSSFGKNKVELVDMSKVKTYNNKTSYYSQNQNEVDDDLQEIDETEEIIEEETS